MRVRRPTVGPNSLIPDYLLEKASSLGCADCASSTPKRLLNEGTPTSKGGLTSGAEASNPARSDKERHFSQKKSKEFSKFFVGGDGGTVYCMPEGDEFYYF